MAQAGFRTVAALLGGMLLWGQARLGLRIVVVEGEGATHNIQLGSGREAVVEVRDENDRPVSGAKVTFSAPERGPSGTFFGASRNLTIATNEQGRATAAGFRPNLQEGRLQVQVTASSGDRTAAAVINQTNVMGGGAATQASGKKSGFGKGKIIAIAAVAAVAVALGASRGGDEPASRPAAGTTITSGTVSVGAPR